MKAELFISKNRVSYVVEALGKDRVTVSEHDGDQDLVVFEVNSPLDLLYMFHAGIQYGSDSMAKALIKQ
jgi:hypothetical protein